MYCTLSGNIPKEPVVSVKSGHLYERSLIEKELSVNGNKCPETGESLTTADLLPVKSGGTVLPLPPEKSSMPHVLDHIRGEWDRVILELHTAKKRLHETRQELATALYRCQASERLIAKLERERDELKETHRTPNGNEQYLSKRTSNHEKKADSNDVQISVDQKPEQEYEKDVHPSKEPHADQSENGTTTLPEGLVKQAQELAEELQASRKARKSAAPGSDAVSSFTELGHTAVDGTDVVVGALCVHKETIFAGCSSGKVHAVKQDMTVSHSEEAHADGVRAICWDEWLFTGGADGVIKVWDESMKCKTIIDGADPIQDIQRHPLKSMLFCCRPNGYEWRSIEDGVVLGSAKDSVSCSAIHPDGLLFATGAEEGIRMWELSSLKPVVELKSKHVRQIAMSEKGYYMVTVQPEEATVWDLRKQGIVGSVPMNGASGLALDEYGEFGCVVGNSGVTVFGAKKKAKIIARLKVHATNSDRLGIAWGGQASCIVVGGTDGILRKFGAPSPRNEQVEAHS